MRVIKNLFILLLLVISTVVIVEIINMYLGLVPRELQTRVEHTIGLLQESRHLTSVQNVHEVALSQNNNVGGTSNVNITPGNNLLILNISVENNSDLNTFTKLIVPVTVSKYENNVDVLRFTAMNSNQVMMSQQYRHPDEIQCNSSYHTDPTQYINIIWQSSKPKLDLQGNSLGTDFRGFRAYFDDRANKNRPDILVIGSTNWNFHQYYRDWLYCVQWYSDGEKRTTKVQQQQIVLRTGLKRINGQYLYQYDIVCPALFHNNQKPTHLSISFDPCSVSMKLPVFYPSSNPQRTFAVCVPAIYGRISNIEALHTIEWIELYRYFGVEKFFFYSAPDIDFVPPLDRVFEYYTKLGVVNITNMPPAVSDFEGVDGFTLSKSVSKNSFDDCLYRNLKEFKYLINVDLDDMMIPRNFESFDSMIKSQNKNRSREYAAYNTNSINYFLDFGPTVNTSDPLITSRYFGNSGAGTIRHKGKIKPIVNPEKCRFMWNHACQETVYRTSITSLSKDAVISHHYRRSCKASYANESSNGTRTESSGRAHHCDENLQNPVITNYANNFRQYLLDKVNTIGNWLKLDMNNHY